MSIKEILIVALNYWTLLLVRERSKFLFFMPLAKGARASTTLSRYSFQHLLGAGCGIQRKACSNHFEGRTSWTLLAKHSPAAVNCHVGVSERSRAMGLSAKPEFTPGCALLHRASVILEKQSSHTPWCSWSSFHPSPNIPPLILSLTTHILTTISQMPCWQNAIS